MGQRRAQLAPPRRRRLEVDERVNEVVRADVPVPRCADADVKKADLATKFGITLDSTRGSVKFFDMGAALNSVTVESALFLDGLIDVAADCRNYANRTSCNALANMVGGGDLSRAVYSHHIQALPRLLHILHHQ